MLRCIYTLVINYNNCDINDISKRDKFNDTLIDFFGIYLSDEAQDIFDIWSIYMFMRDISYLQVYINWKDHAIMNAPDELLELWNEVDNSKQASIITSN